MNNFIFFYLVYLGHHISNFNYVAMYQKPCIDVTKFRDDLCFGQNVAIHLSRSSAK